MRRKAAMSSLIWIGILAMAVHGRIPGIPDGDDKAYRYVKDKDTYLFVRHVPSSYHIMLPSSDVTPVSVYSEDIDKCIGLFMFTLQTGKKSYQVSGKDGAGTLTISSEGQQETPQAVYINGNHNTFLGLSQIHHDYTITVSTKPTSSCNVWLYLRNDVTVTPAPLYKAYVQPPETSAYFLNSDALPSGFGRSADGISLDTIGVAQSAYTYYKGVGRPIPSIALPTADCTGLIVHIEINSLCKVSTEVTTSGYSFTMGAINEIVEKRPTKSYFIFTMTDIYLFISDPLTIRHLGSCSFGPTFQNDAEFLLKTSYDKPETISCSSWPFVFVDEMALRRPPTTTTTVLSTTATAIDDTEEEEEEETDAPAVSSAKTAPIVIGVVCGCAFLLFVIVIIIVIVVYCKKKKKKRNQAAAIGPPTTISTGDMDLSVDKTQVETTALPPMPSNEPIPQLSKEQLAAEAAKNEVYMQKAASALKAHNRIKSARKAARKSARLAKLAAKASAKPPAKPPKTPSVDDRTKTTTVEVVAPVLPPPEPEEIDPDPTTTDYHFKEPETLKHCLGITEEHTKVYRECKFNNFWESVIPQGHIYMDTWPYAFYGRWQANDDVVFRCRDLVAIPQPIFKPLANRVLEPGSIIGPNKWGEPRITCRVFITSYEPFFFEAHFVNKRPVNLAAFAKDILECGGCFKPLFEMSRGQNYNLVSFDDWKTLCCKVKRVPVNHHYVVSVVNPYDPDVVHTVFFIRGEGKDEQIKPCRQGCQIDKSLYHRNSFALQSHAQNVRGEVTDLMPKAFTPDDMLRSDATQLSD